MDRYEYQTIQIDEQTYRLDEHAGTHSYLLLGNEKDLLIDTGCGCGHLRKMVERITDKELIVVNSHGHLDHVGANGQFDCVWIAEEDEALMWKSSSGEEREAGLKDYLLLMDPAFDRKELDRVIHNEQVKQVKHLKDGQIFSLGGRQVEAVATPGHTKGCYCFLDKDRKQLYTADTVCDISILLFLEDSVSVETFGRSIERLYERKNEFRKLYPGHHRPELSPDYIDSYRACAMGILRGTLTGAIHEEALGSGLKAVFGPVGIVYKREWITDAQRRRWESRI